MPDIIVVATAPVNGTSEVQRLAKTGTVTSGQFKLGYKYNTTSWLNFDATATQIRDALRALNEITSNGVNSAGGPISTTPVDLTFAGHLAAANVAQLTLQASTLVGGGSIAISTTTPGVTGTYRGKPTGTVLVAADTGIPYVNTGTDTAPVWKRLAVGSSAPLADLVHAVGVADGTLDDVGGAFNQATLNNNFKELSARMNALASSMRAAGTLLP